MGFIPPPVLLSAAEFIRARELGFADIFEVDPELGKWVWWITKFKYKGVGYGKGWKSTRD